MDNIIYKTVEGSGWINVPNLGNLNPIFDDLERTYIHPQAGNGIKLVQGSGATGNNTIYFEFDKPFKVINKDNILFELIVGNLGDRLFVIHYREICEVSKDF